jgi:hypothetical protein
LSQTAARSASDAARRTRRVRRIISTARHRLIGSSAPDTIIVGTDGCSAPKTSSPMLLPTASQRSGIMVRTKAATDTKMTPTSAAPWATICRGDEVISSM